jgi:hypothetical protein
MRSKATNILQLIVLVTGILYILAGAVFFISPLLLGRIFGIQPAEDWFAQIKYDALFAPIYFFAQGFAALLLTTGISMVMPLFDPLRYRGLIYYAGVLFPLLAAAALIRNGLQYGHVMVSVMGIVFAAVLCLTAAGLAITKNKAKSGEE